MITDKDIKEFYEDVEKLGLKFPVAAISKATGYGKSNVSQYLSAKLDPSESFLRAFYKAFPKSDQIVSEPESYLDKRRGIKNGNGNIPVFVGSTRAGTIEVYSDDPESQSPIGHLPANVFPGCNHAERVSGDSMHPIIINQGYVIGKIVDKRGIIYGEKYIVHTKYGMSVVKYVQKGSKDNLIKLVSYNKHIEPQEIQTDDITFLCRIYFIVNPS